MEVTVSSIIIDAAATELSLIDYFPGAPDDGPAQAVVQSPASLIPTATSVMRSAFFPF
jgi:hypothetical protein